MGGDHDHTDPPSDEALRVKALESLLVEKGLINPEAVDAIIDQFENHIGPHNGARVVARAWRDPDYRARLLDDAWPALQELDVGGVEAAEVVVIENTPDVHNWSSAPSARVTRGRSSVCRRAGTNHRPTVLVP